VTWSQRSDIVQYARLYYHLIWIGGLHSSRRAQKAVCVIRKDNDVSLWFRRKQLSVIFRFWFLRSSQSIQKIRCFNRIQSSSSSSSPLSSSPCTDFNIIVGYLTTSHPPTNAPLLSMSALPYYIYIYVHLLSFGLSVLSFVSPIVYSLSYCLMSLEERYFLPCIARVYTTAPLISLVFLTVFLLVQILPDVQLCINVPYTLDTSLLLLIY
jgi:hypothetical protein